MFFGAYPWAGWLAFAATLPVQFVAGWPILRGAVQQARALTSNMDTLIALGTLTAFVYSTYQLFAGGPLFFDTSALIIAFVVLGRHLEARATGKASEAISKLLELEHRLVDGGAPIGDLTVDRDLLSGPHPHQVSDLDLIDRHQELLAVDKQRGFLGADRRARRAPRSTDTVAARSGAFTTILRSASYAATPTAPVTTVGTAFARNPCYTIADAPFVCRCPEKHRSPALVTCCWHPASAPRWPTRRPRHRRAARVDRSAPA